MLTQKDIQAQLKTNADVLRILLEDMGNLRDLAAYFYGKSKECAASVEYYFLERHSMYLDDYYRTKNKFLALSTVQAKLKRMLANVARGESVKIEEN